MRAYVTTETLDRAEWPMGRPERDSLDEAALRLAEDVRAADWRGVHVEDAADFVAWNLGPDAATDAVIQRAVGMGLLRRNDDTVIPTGK